MLDVDISWTLAGQMVFYLLAEWDMNDLLDWLMTKISETIKVIRES